MATNTIDIKHLPDWRQHPAYVEAAAKLDAVRAVLPDLSAKEIKAVLAVTEAQDALDEIETLQITNRAKPRDVEFKRTRLEAAERDLAEAVKKRKAAERQMKLLENGVSIVCDATRQEVAQQLSAVATAAMERLSAIMAEAVAANEEYRQVRAFIVQQFPGFPGDASYAGALGMPGTPWNDLHPQIQGRGFKNETAYTIWARRMAEWLAQMPANALPRPQRPERASA